MTGREHPGERRMNSSRHLSGVVDAVPVRSSPRSPRLLQTGGMTDIVLLKISGPVATVTLNNPEQRGALTFDAMLRLRSIFEELADRSDVRAVILASEGKVFSSGHNLREMSSDDFTWVNQFFTASAEMMLAIRRMPQPVIAQVHASAAAAGCQLIAGSDLAVAADTARFSVAGPRIGQFPTLPAVSMIRTCGQKASLRMYLTGEDIDAHEAQRMGLLSHVVPESDVVEETRRIAEKIASFSGQVIGDGKRAFYEMADIADESTAYHYAVQAVVANTLMPDGQEGAAAFLEKRTPEWLHRPN